ncbi:hypothetical protein D3C87_2050910 [compost metagenome]
MMRRQIGPILQAHIVRVERRPILLKQGGEEAAQQGDDARHFVTSFQVASVLMPNFCARSGPAAMDKVAATL